MNKELSIAANYRPVSVVWGGVMEENERNWQWPDCRK